MSAVDEHIVREFFELHGFLVCQRRKYIGQSRQQTGNEEVDLIILNPVSPAIAGKNFWRRSFRLPVLPFIIMKR